MNKTVNGYFNGRRTSITLPVLLCELHQIDFGLDGSSGMIQDYISEYGKAAKVRDAMIMDICKSSVLAKYRGQEQQMDIED